MPIPQVYKFEEPLNTTQAHDITHYEHRAQKITISNPTVLRVQVQGTDNKIQQEW